MDIFLHSTVADLNDLIKYVEQVKKCIMVVKKYSNNDMEHLALEMALQLSVLINQCNNADTLEKIYELQHDIYKMMNCVRIKYQVYVAHYYQGCLNTPFISYHC